MHDKISVIVPILNEASNVAALEAHIHKSALHEVEVIFCDSPNSTDFSYRKLFHHHTLYIKCKKAGRAAQMNHGARSAKGDIILFCHADVKLPFHFDVEIKNCLAEGHEMGLFKYRFSPTNALLNINAAQTGKDGIFVGGGDQCHFFTRKSFFDLGGYDEHYVIMEDFALFKKVKKSNLPYKIIQKPAIVSARKYQKNSYLKVNLINLIAFTMFGMRISPQFIKNFYSNALKS